MYVEWLVCLGEYRRRFKQACLCALWIICGGMCVWTLYSVCVTERRVGHELRTKNGMFVLKPSLFSASPSTRALFIFLLLCLVSSSISSSLWLYLFPQLFATLPSLLLVSFPFVSLCFLHYSLTFFFSVQSAVSQDLWIFASYVSIFHLFVVLKASVYAVVL